jgi:low affinity Fe/Cu permease
MSQGSAATQGGRSISWFPALSRKLAGIAGRGPAFALALGLVLAWVVTGPLFDYSEAWQLTINTGTTIVTFLMVFLIQNTQNRDTEAIQIKLDEIIRATRGAHNEVLDLEEASDEELAAYHKRYEELAAYARNKLKQGGSDEDVPELGDRRA